MSCLGCVCYEESKRASGVLTGALRESTNQGQDPPIGSCLLILPLGSCGLGLTVVTTALPSSATCFLQLQTRHRPALALAPFWPSSTLLRLSRVRQ